MVTCVRAGLLAAALAGLSLPAAAQTSPASCAELGTAGAALAALVGLADGLNVATVDSLCGQLGDLNRRAEAAEAQAAELRTVLDLTQAQLPPVGSIMLVDDGRGCPEGWTDVAIAEPEVFAGRVPVATGLAGEVFRGYREVGGSEQTVLTEAELPAHTHSMPLAFDSRHHRGGAVEGPGRSLGGGFGAGGSYGDQVPVRALAGQERTARAGAGLPFNNMPPFVGLFWCRRS